MKRILLSVAMTMAFVVAGTDRAAAVTQTEKEAQDMVAMFVKADPTLKQFFATCVGYAIFPEVTKAAIGLGGAQGGGYVYEKNVLIGKSKLTQMTLGWALGAQSYAELIFFETADALNQFKKSETVLAAQLSAVAAADGAAAKANYKLGMAVFTVAKGGLMFEASVGGQKLRFTPLAK
jgi:lipid-binding SYLF domain-containing protein